MKTNSMNKNDQANILAANLVNPLYRKYVAQRGDNLCQFVTLLNYQVEKFGRPSLRYHSKRFWEIAQQCGGTLDEAIINIKPAADYLRLRLIDGPVFKLIHRFEQYLISNLNNGIMVSFKIWPPIKCTGHCFLITHYFKETGLFRVINSGLLSSNLIELVPFYELVKECYYKNQIYAIYNDKESTTHGLLDTILQTKLIVPKGSPRLKTEKKYIQYARKQRKDRLNERIDAIYKKIDGTDLNDSEKKEVLFKNVFKLMKKYY
jgi:hypothetical protein